MPRKTKTISIETAFRKTRANSANANDLLEAQTIPHETESLPNKKGETQTSDKQFLSKGCETLTRVFNENGGPEGIAKTILDSADGERRVFITCKNSTDFSFLSRLLMKTDLFHSLQKQFSYEIVHQEKNKISIHFYRPDITDEYVIDFLRKLLGKATDLKEENRQKKVAERSDNRPSWNRDRIRAALTVLRKILKENALSNIYRKQTETNVLALSMSCSDLKRIRCAIKYYLDRNKKENFSLVGIPVLKKIDNSKDQTYILEFEFAETCSEEQQVEFFKDIEKWFSKEKERLEENALLKSPSTSDRNLTVGDYQFLIRLFKKSGGISEILNTQSISAGGEIEVKIACLKGIDCWSGLRILQSTQFYELSEKYSWTAVAAQKENAIKLKFSGTGITSEHVRETLKKILEKAEAFKEQHEEIRKNKHHSKPLSLKLIKSFIRRLESIQNNSNRSVVTMKTETKEGKIVFTLEAKKFFLIKSIRSAINHYLFHNRGINNPQIEMDCQKKNTKNRSHGKLVLKLSSSYKGNFFEDVKSWFEGKLKKPSNPQFQEENYSPQGEQTDSSDEEEVSSVTRSEAKRKLSSDEQLASPSSQNSSLFWKKQKAQAEPEQQPPVEPLDIFTKGQRKKSDEEFYALFNI